MMKKLTAALRPAVRVTLIAIAAEAIVNAKQNATSCVSKIVSIETPPKNCVATIKGNAPINNAVIKNNRPNKLPRTICKGESGVDKRISQVFGFASFVIALAINIGVSNQINSN